MRLGGVMFGLRRRLLLLAACAFLEAGCTGRCANRVVSYVRAPDDTRSAVLFERRCGRASAGGTTRISIVHWGAGPVSGKGNVFVADDGGRARDGSWGGVWAQASWVHAPGFSGPPAIDIQ